MFAKIAKIVAAAAVTAGIAVGGYLLYKRHEDSKLTNPSSPEQFDAKFAAEMKKVLSDEEFEAFMANHKSVADALKEQQASDEWVGMSIG
jgi:hypothetical protein